MHIEQFQRYNCRRNLAWLVFAVIGFFFGCGFCGVVFMTHGGGHGTLLPLGIYSSPLGIFGIFVAFFGMPILWSFVGILCYEMLESGSKRVLFLVVMGLHFGFIPWLLSNDLFGDYSYFWKVYGAIPVELTACFILYGLAQALAWSCFVVGCYKRRTQFSIRTLLVVTLLFAIWLSCMAMVVRGPQAKTDADQHTKANITEE